MLKIRWTLIALLILAMDIQVQSAIKVGFLGDSITEGAGLPNPAEDGYCGQLALYLGDEYEVGNFGISSRTLLKNGDYPIWVEQELSDALAFGADIFFIMLGTNDSKPQNWDLYGDEFYDDYVSMVDTFSLGPNPPEIWAVLPPPAFTQLGNIRDSVIVNGIIPVIEQVVADKGINLLDFYTPFIGRDDLFGDGIHPSVAGAEEMARILYETLTGGAIRQIRDINLAKNKLVQVDNDLGETAANLTDGRPLTAWQFIGQPSTAVVDLGESDSTDAFVIHVPQSSEAGLQYTLEGSLDSTSWTLLVDQSARPDSVQMIFADTIPPQDVRYVRLTFTGSTRPDSVMRISELKVLRYNGGHHAHGMTVEFDRQTSKWAYFNIYFAPVSDRGERLKMYRNDGEGFGRFSGYRDPYYALYRASIRAGDTTSYYISDYLNGVDVISDTVSLFYLDTAVESETPAVNPGQFELGCNFPNPFNPETSIYYVTDQPGVLNLSIYNMLGERVVTLFSGEASSNQRRMIRWDGRDSQNIPVSSGIYILKMEQGARSLVRKIQLIR